MRKSEVYFLFISVAIFMTLAFYGCKTSPSTPKVQPEPEKKTVEKEEELPVEQDLVPLALIGKGFSIYASIPVTNHRDLTAELLTEEIENLSDTDAMLIAKRIDMLYAGLGTVSDRSRLEAVAEGNIPPIGIKTTFTKKNGWSKNSYKDDLSYYAHDDSRYDICFFSQKLFSIAQDLTPVMDRYAEKAVLDETRYTEWISRKSDDILFYITRPGQYLRSLIGASINASTDRIYGSMQHIRGNIYNMQMNIHVTDRSSIQSLKSMLALSFGLTGASLSQKDNETLVLSKVEVTQQQIVNLFTRDPITGKHYRIEGDKILEEAR